MISACSNKIVKRSSCYFPEFVSTSIMNHSIEGCIAHAVIATPTGGVSLARAAPPPPPLPPLLRNSEGDVISIEALTSVALLCVVVTDASPLFAKTSSIPPSRNLVKPVEFIGISIRMKRNRVKRDRGEMNDCQ
jgi:hypothetical protein